jgi:3-deoxy-manno-octulosonate cytidylyltransferase (CMP-KDO synthetase)
VPTEDEAERAEPERGQGGGRLHGRRPGLGRRLYFTRATAPSGPGPVYHHIGIYAFTRDALERFAGLPPSPLERRERLEQLRALETA